MFVLLNVVIETSCKQVSCKFVDLIEQNVPVSELIDRIRSNEMHSNKIMFLNLKIELYAKFKRLLSDSDVENSSESH